MPSLVVNFCKLFADDSKLIAVIKDVLDLNALQVDIDRLVDWSIKWKMCFNEEKCKSMFFDKRKHGTLNRTFIAEDEPLGTHQRFTIAKADGGMHTIKNISYSKIDSGSGS
jgi:hypothetical protein